MFLVPMILALIFYYWVMTRAKRYIGTNFCSLRKNHFSSTGLNSAVKPVKEVKARV